MLLYQHRISSTVLRNTIFEMLISLVGWSHKMRFLIGSSDEWDNLP